MPYSDTAECFPVECQKGVRPLKLPAYQSYSYTAQYLWFTDTSNKKNTVTFETQLRLRTHTERYLHTQKLSFSLSPFLAKPVC